MTDAHVIVYAAHTKGYTFLLDENGICRRVLMAVDGKVDGGGLQVAERCVGAQYIASLDVSVSGGLVKDPTVGVPLLFARIDDGRVALVRTSPLERFDSYEDADTRRYADATETQEIQALDADAPTVHTAESAPETEHEIEEDVATGDLGRNAKLASDEDITHETNDDDDDLSTNELPRDFSTNGAKPAVRTRIVAPPGRPHPLLASRRPSLTPPPSRKQSESESRLPAIRR